jgi:superfamily I DNA and/or RNA helicase
MKELHPHQQRLLECISLEVKAQEERLNLSEGAGLKQLKSQGLALHPIKVTRKSFGYADYPEVEFQLHFASDTQAFRPNSAIEFVLEGEQAIKGVYLGGDERKGAIRLFAPDFPDWTEDRDVLVKLAPDDATSKVMSNAVKNLSDFPNLMSLFSAIHGDETFGFELNNADETKNINQSLNESQRAAVEALLANDSILLIHGPPGTGKTTTLVEGIQQLLKEDRSVVATAPSNAAVDHLTKCLVRSGVKVLRLGNTVRIDDAVYAYTAEGRMQGSKEEKTIKKLKIQAEEYRRMALQYKRKFGKEERTQRDLLFKEVKRIRTEIKALKNYFDSKLLEEAEVVLGTPVVLAMQELKGLTFDTLVFDEAGQALEPLAWSVFPLAQRWVLAGDPFQLPPTVISEEAAKKGLAVSILEQCFKNCRNTYLLDTQYRMRASIAKFSSDYFYKSALKTPDDLADFEQHLVFYDTAGTGFEEQTGKEEFSLENPGELDIIHRLIEAEKLNEGHLTIISPYAAQTSAARERFSKRCKVSTIDSIQGQENKVVILSLVRSNPDGTIGFLKDYRRMNVAMTRAKEQLYVIGDSATIGQDPFYAAFLEFVDSVGGYRSAWELM